ncbi:MAG TPA: hypothetical protein VGF50_12515 [Caulobacteraceae bacterium]|jgi:hypothetical protein
MKQLAFALFIATAWCATSGAAHAQTFAPAPNSNYTVDLDSADGRFSRWSANDISGVDGLQATMTVRRLGHDPQFAPSFQVRLINASGGGAFKIIGSNGALVATAQSWAGDKYIDNQTFVVAPQLDTPFHLEMHWAADNSISILIRTRTAEERHEVRLGAPPGRLEVTSSTGQVKLEELQLGRTSP